MVTHEDEIPIFVPKESCRFIILGTMGSINARTIDGQKPVKDFFYYNNFRNQFWNVIQYLFQPNEDARKMTIPQKRKFLEQWGVGMSNIVQCAQVPNHSASDPSDTVLFDAHKKGRVQFKSCPPKFRKLVESKPMLFTCREKKGIKQLLTDFFIANQLDPKLIAHVWFWPTPTRCNARDRAKLWRAELDQHLQKFSTT